MTKKKSATSATKSRATKKTPTKTAKALVKNSLVANINRRKKAGTSRSKKDSTVSPEAYLAMKEGWPSKSKQK